MEFSVQCLDGEIWKPSSVHDGLMVSNLGRVCLPVREYVMPNGGARRTNPKPTFGTKTKKSKNVTIMCLQNRTFGNIRIHLEVCREFNGPKPFAGAVVMHIDENSMNNRACNLKWGTQKENLNAPKFIAYCKSRTGENSPVRKGIKKRG